MARGVIGYPYPRPPTSFVFVTGAGGAAAGACAFHPLPNAAWRGADTAAVLALPVGPAAPAAPATTTRAAPAAGSSTNLAAAAAAGASAAAARVDNGGGVFHTLAAALRELHGIEPGELLPPGTPLTPILAIGSNAGPEQLARKFPPALFPRGAVVPVIQCVLTGFDVAYAPLISSYGSATATLEASPGTEVEVFITYLTPPLQQRMHETEGAYDLLRLDGIHLEEGRALAGSEWSSRTLDSVYQYNHSLGTLHLPLARRGGGGRGGGGGGASPIALAEIPATGRRFPALTQVEMQAALMRGFLQGSASSGGSASASAGGSGGDSDDAEAVWGAGAAAAAAGPLAPVELPAAAAAPLRSSAASAAAAGGASGNGGSGGGAAAFDGGGGGDLEEFILSNLRLPGVRAARVAALAAHAAPFSYLRHERLMTLGSMFSKNVE
ncbi:MAG: hypothetical protein J3K34DRAFT_479333 [Monoraphidium minutum]|nr:MAG: hypothetical protein J3K34DRAFT_479333 [Monoraphidium minutum]